jgi:phage baseplate assembly protein W
MIFRRRTIVEKPQKRNAPKSTRPIGVVLPFSSDSLFKLSYTTVDQFKSNLRNLLLTAKGERYFLPDFGTDIRRILFENITDEEDFRKMLESEIETAISTWMPFLIIQYVRVSVADVDFNGDVSNRDHVVKVAIEVMIQGTNIYIPVSLSISDTADIRIEEFSV